MLSVPLEGLKPDDAGQLIVKAPDSETAVVLVSTHRRADLPPGLDDCGAAAFTPKEDVDVDALVALVTSG